jgi:hypothetical protein
MQTILTAPHIDQQEPSLKEVSHLDSGALMMFAAKARHAFANAAATATEITHGLVAIEPI